MMMIGELEIVCINMYSSLISPGRAVVPSRVMSQRCGQLPLSHQTAIG